MRTLILLLSITSLFISAIWAYKTNYDYEPITVFIMGIVGILYFFLKPKKDEEKQVPINKIAQENKVKQESEVKQNVSININTSDTQKENTSSENRKNNSHARDANIESMKSKVKILFIDDDKTFNVVKILKSSGWKNTKSIIDIKSIDIPAIKDADIFFVDINGVGKILELPNEGLDIALMLKQKYPNRKVVIYSANKNNNIFHKAWDLCDFKLEKNALPYQFQSLVEQYSLDLI